MNTNTQEQWPPDGYTFCEVCEGAGWEERFGAFAWAGADRPDRLRYDVMEGDAQLLHVLAVSPGPDGWVAEFVPGPPQTDEDGEVWQPQMWPCDCGGGAPMLRVAYRDVYLVDHHNNGRIIN